MKADYDANIKDNKVICGCGREVLSNKYAVHCQSKIHSRLLEPKDKVELDE